MSINRTVLVGRMGKPADLRTTNTGKDVAEFSIAVDNRSNKDEPFWFRIKAWDQKAKYIAEYGGKGRLVSVDGRLETRKYEDKEGVTREVVEVVADNLSLLDKPKEAGE